MDILYDMGVSKLSANIFFLKKWTTPLMLQYWIMDLQTRSPLFSFVYHGSHLLYALNSYFWRGLVIVYFWWQQDSTGMHWSTQKRCWEVPHETVLWFTRTRLEIVCEMHTQ